MISNAVALIPKNKNGARDRNWLRLLSACWPRGERRSIPQLESMIFFRGAVALISKNIIGALDRNRTGTRLLETDFKSAASTNSATRAQAYLIFDHNIEKRQTRPMFYK